MGIPTIRLTIFWKVGEDIRVYFIFRAANCDTDHSRNVAKVRERLAINRFHMEKFNPKKLNKVEDEIPC
jgi:hypothetical protein